MTALPPDHRDAVPDDALALALLIDRAGEGIPTYLWGGAADPGETPLDVGRRRAARDTGGFSYTNAVVREADGQVAAMLLGYRQPDPYETGDLEGLPAFLRPMVELEALAPGSWYVNALAVLPGYEGRGFATALLDVAEARARAAGATSLSIIVAEANVRARSLYERQGYSAAAHRPIVAFEGFAHTGDWVLMVKPAG